MDTPPQRIVSLSPALTALACALGASDRIVGISDLCGWPATTAPTRCGAPRTPAIDTLRALAPDCILATHSETDTSLVRAEFGLAIVLHVTQIATFGDAAGQLAALARRIGCAPAGQHWCTALDDALARADARAQTPPPRALLVLWAQPWIAAGAESFAGDLIARCGAHNVAAQFGGRNPRAALDQFMRYNPAVIVLAQRAATPHDPGVFRRFGDVLAVMRRRIHLIDADHVAQLNPALPAAVVQITDWLHPDREGR